MNDAPIHVFNHHAMATVFQARIACEDKPYAAQAARAAFDVADRLEELLSRFREHSEISQIARLAPGDRLRLSEPTAACLEIARRMELATRGAFSVTPSAVPGQDALPRWSILGLEVRCDAGRLEFDLGAIGKGFALDRMADELAEWDCARFLLVAGGSSVLAGAPPAGASGWSVGLGEDNAEPRYFLVRGSFSGSGMAVKGQHILDPRTGRPVQQRARAWVLASTAAESDALSTACMVLTEPEIAEAFGAQADWLVFLQEVGGWRHYGDRKVPERAE